MASSPEKKRNAGTECDFPTRVGPTRVLSDFGRHIPRPTTTATCPAHGRSASVRMVIPLETRCPSRPASILRSTTMPHGGAMSVTSVSDDGRPVIQSQSGRNGTGHRSGDLNLSGRDRKKKTVFHADVVFRRRETERNWTDE